MVLKRKIECGFIGYDSPNIPRARRSVRKRSPCKKAFDDGQLCPFELLAAVAGKLLQESESSSASTSAAAIVDNNRNSIGDCIKQEPVHLEDVAMRTERVEPGSSEESVVSSNARLQKCTQKDSDKEANYSCSAKAGSDVKPVVIHRSENDFNKLSGKADGDSPKFGESFGPSIIHKGAAPFGRCEEVNVGSSDAIGTADKFSPKEQVGSCGKLSPPIHSGNKVNLASCKGSAPDASYAKHRNAVKLDGTDDDEILSRLTDSSSQGKSYRSPTHGGDLRMGKLLTSKYWESAPKLTDSRPTNSGIKRNNAYPNGMSSYERERSQPTTPFKKRKLFGQSSTITHDGGNSSESVSNPSEKGIQNKRDSVAKPHPGKVSSSGMERQRSFNSRNSHAVKLSIKSFTVPELLIEVPESTSVGSLKKTVMEAVTTVLGGGLRVGVLLHGKKIRDDTKTLLQAGISKEDNLVDLDFILEPSTTNQVPANPHEHSPAPPACHSPKDYVNRSPNKTKEELPFLETPNKTSVKESGKHCQDLVPFSPLEMDKKPALDSRALVPIRESSEALALVPMGSRPRRSEMGQRRTRRPFSVSEVEALVQAVEKLGTGRWRDVKLCAFENAKHRTYVDLKDKWKTLVHTARISPQQRRGEPVPQELLDRVLAAHAYWSQHQAKQHGKAVHSSPSGMLKFSDSSTEKVAT